MSNMETDSRILPKMGEVIVGTEEVPEDFVNSLNTDESIYLPSQIPMNVKRLTDSAIIPTYGTKFSAGADLYADIAEEVTIEPGKQLKIPTGISLEIPTEFVGLIFARSGKSIKEGLAPSNKVGVIDSDYRGEIMVYLYNQSNQPQTVKPGERIAQIIFTKYQQANFIEKSELSSTERDNGGFGSTGRD